MSGNKPLPKPTLKIVNLDSCYHMASQSHNELIDWGWDKVQHSANCIFKCISMNENHGILTEILLMIDSKGSINN